MEKIEKDEIISEESVTDTTTEDTTAAAEESDPALSQAPTQEDAPSQDNIDAPANDVPAEATDSEKPAEVEPSEEPIADSSEAPAEEAAEATEDEENKVGGDGQPEPVVPLSEVPPADGLDKYAIPNDEDTADLADEIGVSGIYDAYGREIIPDVFENRLRLSKNSVKLAYSKLKNTILSYFNVKRSYVGKAEKFEFNGKLMFRFTVENDALVLTYDGNHRISVKKEKGGESIKKAIEIVNEKMTEAKAKKIPSYAATAYAERYPFNPDAVLRGHEDEAPVEGAFASKEYDPIEGELTKDIVEELMGEDFDLEAFKGRERLEAMRQQATTIKGAVALTEPIVYFYNAARDNENNIGYVTVQQVLNDKFLGKILPQQFFAIAEGSDRIETLNLLSIEQTAKDCDENPTLTFVTQASARLLLKDKILARLIKTAATENKNLALAFDCALLDAMGDKGLAALREVAASGVKIMIDNTENAGLRVLTEYPIDFLRFDARYYKEEDERKAAHLDMILGYAKVQGINTSALYVNTLKEAKFLLAHGVRNIEGDVVAAPVRMIHNAVKEAKKLPIPGK